MDPERKDDYWWISDRTKSVSFAEVVVFVSQKKKKKKDSF